MEGGDKSDCFADGLQLSLVSILVLMEGGDKSKKGQSKYMES